MKDFIYDCLRRIGAHDIRPTSEGFEAVCPYHSSSSGKRSFRVALESSKRGTAGKPGAWKCHHAACEASRGGYLPALVMRAYRVSWEEAKQIAAQHGDFSTRRAPEEIEDRPEPSQLYPYVGVECPYLLERGFAQEDLDRHEIGYNAMKNEVVIPTFDTSGQLVGLTTRPAQPKGRYNHSKFKKSEHVWGLHLHRRGEPITITEGQLDPIGLRPHWDDCIVAQMGSSLSERQAELIAERTDVVYLCYDNDEAGVLATFGAIETLREQGLTDIYILEYNGSDPADLTRQGGEITRIERSGRWIGTHLQ